MYTKGRRYVHENSLWNLHVDIYMYVTHIAIDI